jgi:hypothetical protein
VVAPTLKKGARGPAVRELQRLLTKRGYPVAVDGDFGLNTQRAVRAFQSQNLDPTGAPLVIDGTVGPLTWWSLTHPKPDYPPRPGPVDFAKMPPNAAGGSRRGRAALAAAISQLDAGACEIGGNNCGKWVRQYLNELAPEGNSWCAGFVSWCFANARPRGPMPFTYTVGARDVLRQGKRLEWAHGPGTGYEPVPGDIVVWWRERLEGWKGHVGLVHQVRDGLLYTIEGNKSPRVQGFSYVVSRMDKLLGYVHVPDAEK